MALSKTNLPEILIPTPAAPLIHGAKHTGNIKATVPHKPTDALFSTATVDHRVEIIARGQEQAVAEVWGKATPIQQTKVAAIR